MAEKSEWDSLRVPTQEELDSIKPKDDWGSLEEASVEDIQKQDVGAVRAVESEDVSTWNFPSLKETLKEGVKNINPDADTSNFSGGGVAGVIDEGLNVLGHATNIPKNIATRQAANLDTAYNWIGEKTGFFEPTANTSERIAKAVPEYRPEKEGTVEDIKRIAVESLIPGGVVFKGAKGLKFVADNPSIVTKTAENLTKLLAVEMAAISGVSPGEDTVFMDVVGRDPQGNYSEELAKENINLLAEAAVIGKLGELGIRTVSGLAKFINTYGIAKVKKFVNGEALEDAVVEDTATPLIVRRGDETVAEEANQFQDLADKARAGKEKRIKVQEGPIDDELVFKRDTMGAIASQTEDKGLQTRAASSNRSLQRAQDTNDLTQRRAQPIEETDRFLSEVDEGYGGAKGRTESLEKIQDTLEETPKRHQNIVDQTEKALETADKEIVDLMKNDPDLGPKLAQLSDTVNGVGLRRINNMRAGEAINQIQDIGKKISKNVNDKFEAISDKAEVNLPEVKASYRVMKDSINEGLPDNLKFPNALVKRIEGEGDTVLASFKDWNKIVNFNDWNRYRRALVEAKEFDAVRLLDTFKKYIHEDQLEYIATHGGGADAQKAKEAVEYYRENYAPYLRDNKTIQDIVEYGRDYKNAPKTNIVESRAVLNKSLTDDNAMEFNDSMSEFLQKNGPEGAKPITDVAIGRIAQRAQKMINDSPDGILDENNFKILREEYEKYALTLEGADSAQRIRLDNFFESLKGKKSSKKELQETLKTAKKDYATSVQDLQKSGFFRERMGETIRRTDAEETFNKIFRMEESGDEIKRLSQEHPEAVDGLKSSFYNKLKQDILNFEGSAAKFDKTKQDEFNKMMKIGKELFGKDSPLIEATEITHEFLQKMHAKGPYEDILDTRSHTKDVRGLMEFAVTQIFGPLNRWGARVRSAGSRVISGADTAKQVEAILDRIYSDPEEFARILERVADKKRKSGSTLSDQDKRYINKWISTSLAYGMNSEENPQDKETIENILNQNLDKSNKEDETEAVLDR